MHGWIMRSLMTGGKTCDMRDDKQPQVDLNGPIGDWLARSIGKGSKLVRSKRLVCGPSSPVHLVEAELRGRIERYVLRLFVDQDWLKSEPDLAQHEVAVLQHAVAHGLPAPEVIAFCPDSAACGHPAVLMTFLKGSVNLNPSNLDEWLSQMAQTLARIHGVPSDGLGWHYFSFTEPGSVGVPSWSKRPDLWQEAVRIRRAGPPEDGDAFLHRDYHQVNILWEADELTGVVDWVNACTGPAGVDVAHCCMNLASMCGVDVANSFRSKYEQAAGSRSSYHPFWDIDTIIGWGTPTPGFYPPWMEYGLKHPGQQSLFERQDQHLLSVLNRI